MWAGGCAQRSGMSVRAARALCIALHNHALCADRANWVQKGPSSGSPYEESRREDGFIVGSKQQSKACNEHAGQRAKERCYMSGGAGEAVGHAREASATDRPELRKLE